MIAEDLINYLENEGFGTIGTDLFLSFTPDNPDNSITCVDEIPPTLPESNCLSIDMFTVQILVRNNNYTIAKNQSINIHKKIVGFGGQSLIENGNIVSYITINTMPTSIGRDEKGRSSWSSHYNLRVESENDSYRL